MDTVNMKNLQSLIEPLEIIKTHPSAQQLEVWGAKEQQGTTEWKGQRCKSLPHNRWSSMCRRSYWQGTLQLWSCCTPPWEDNPSPLDPGQKLKNKGEGLRSSKR